MGIFSCPAPGCRMVNINKEVDFCLAMAIKGSASVENSCDYCGVLGRKVHRCSECKTKVYCSEECLQLDWKKIHSKICNEGEVASKVKGGKKEREAKEEQVSDQITTDIANDLTIDPLRKERFLDTFKKMK